MDRETAELLREDMADHQRRMGQEPTDDANARLVGPELERLEKVWEDLPPPLPPPPVAPRTETVVENRQVADRDYKVKLEPDRPLIRKANEFEAWFLSHAMPRVHLLITLVESGPRGAPSWSTRTLSVMGLRTKAAAWQAAAESPADLLRYRHQIEKDQRILKLWGLETISQLTPAFARHKQHELEQQFVNELCLLLDESDALGFGSWKDDPEKKVTVSG